jgi:hypothetical protein
MADGLLSPLQLTGGAGLLQNTGITLNSEFTSNVTTYEAIGPIANLLATISFANSANLTPGTIASLQSLGSSVCPALGDSVPSSSANTAPFSIGNNASFLSTLETIGNTYLGNGDVGKFAQAFFAAQGYVSIVNLFIISAANANDYLGPTFTNLDNLITADLSKVTTDLGAWGEDLAALGNAIDLGKLDHLGEPATLLQQLSAQGNMTDRTLPCIQGLLNMVGLSDNDIANLITDNRQSLFNPNGLTANQFDRLQQRAYTGMSMVDNDCLTTALNILDVTTPNITTLTDLLDPVAIFPNSYSTLKFNDTLIYNQGDVNSSIINNDTPTGCDELGKIIPPPQAVANKAIAYQLSQVGGIFNTTLPALAAILVA